MISDRLTGQLNMILDDGGDLTALVHNKVCSASAALC